jgi:ABC-type ATPase involved in cell division
VGSCWLHEQCVAVVLVAIGTAVVMITGCLLKVLGPWDGGYKVNTTERCKVRFYRNHIYRIHGFQIPNVRRSVSAIYKQQVSFKLLRQRVI